SAERTVELIPGFAVSETGKRVRTMSSALASARGVADQGKFVNQPIKIDPGLTAKFVMSSAATVDLAVNPDFAQVEADATVSTANQRFPIFFEEKRPFFLEGIDIFRTLIAAVHTRTIIDPDIAAKFTGKRGRNTYGLLFASDNAPGDFTNEQRFDPEALPAAGNRIIGKNATIGIAYAYNITRTKRHLVGTSTAWRAPPGTVPTLASRGASTRTHTTSTSGTRPSRSRRRRSSRGSSTATSAATTTSRGACRIGL